MKAGGLTSGQCVIIRLYELSDAPRGAADSGERKADDDAGPPSVQPNNKKGPDLSGLLAFQFLFSIFDFLIPYRDRISGRLSAIVPTGGMPFRLSSICSLR
jgi:hypothetical protein